MTVPQILNEFAHDKQVQAAFILILADVIFGVLSALKTNTFRLVRIADTLRDDVLGKVAPWLAVFALGKVSNADVLGIDFGTAADVAWAGVTLALGASILNSLKDFGINLPDKLAGSATPPA